MFSHISVPNLSLSFPILPCRSIPFSLSLSSCYFLHPQIVRSYFSSSSRWTPFQKFVEVASPHSFFARDRTSSSVCILCRRIIRVKLFPNSIDWIFRIVKCLNVLKFVSTLLSGKKKNQSRPAYAYLYAEHEGIWSQATSMAQFCTASCYAML